MRIEVFSWQEKFITTLGSEALLAFEHTDELNGEDSVAITTTYPLKAGYRLLWTDRLGGVHEHICQDPKGLHSDGITLYTDTAINSICELYGDYIDDKRPYSYSFYKALQVALEPTRWSIGTVDQTGTVSSGLTFYHTNAREALNDILECGGELETVITFSDGAVSKRAVNIRLHRGSSSTHKRFTYSKDINSVSRTEHAGAITACYGYGKGVETDSGGYGRKLTFGEVNGGLNYVTDSTALKSYGRPDSSGNFAHVFGIYENSECEDANQLLKETKAYLAENNQPSVSYEADVIDLVAMGRSWEGVSVGDDVQIVDTAFEPELRCSGRVSKLVVDMLGGTQTVTLGNITKTIADTWQAQQQAVSSLSKRSSNWDVAATTPTAYLQQLIDGLNEQFNTSGMSYCFTSFEQGTIWASVPLDENGLPVDKSGTCSAIQICSQGFRIASGLKSDGTWDWRTFGTGDGFTADLINAGKIDADLIQTGRLTVNDSNNNAVFYADVDEGSVYIGGANVNIGSSTTTVENSLKAAANKYGYCYTAAGTSAKTVSISDFVLQTGSTVAVYFSYANTAAYPTLNVSSTGAKSIKYAGSKLTSKYYWNAGDVLTFTYDGSAWQLNDSSARKNSREIWANDTSAVTVSAGAITFNSNTFVCNSSNFKVSANGTVTATNMNATNITATGNFTGGSTTSGYGMQLNSYGKLVGYKDGSEIAHMSANASATNIDTGVVSYGMQLYGSGIIREATPIYAVASSSNIGDTSTSCITGSYNVIKALWDDNGVIRWTYGPIQFINGRCVFY